MVKFRPSIKRMGNVVYNNITQIPFSVVKGLSWLHCLPSHVNYLSKMEECGFLEKVDPQVENPFWAETETSSYLVEKKALRNHYYGKISRLGENLIRGKSKLELGLSVIPQHVVSVISGISAGVGYGYAVSEYGLKALIPLAITTGLSLIHELRFNKKLRDLDDSIYTNNKEMPNSATT